MLTHTQELEVFLCSFAFRLSKSMEGFVSLGVLGVKVMAGGIGAIEKEEEKIKIVIPFFSKQYILHGFWWDFCNHLHMTIPSID